jgi:molybdopterin/thiamine biosynthesis adenylyltransferase
MDGSKVVPKQPLTKEERAVYEWQMWTPGFGEAGQERLKASSVLISRCGGLGGMVALELAAAGVGKLILAHGGNIKASDLNRQVLMTHSGIGTSRTQSAVVKLLELNPFLKVEAVPENICEQNAAELVEQADLVVDCAPLFEERFLLNREVVRQNKPMVECAIYELEAHLTTIFPGATPCLACLYPEFPDYWGRQFPVFGAVAGAAGCLAAMEAIKVLGGFGSPLADRQLVLNLRSMQMREYRIRRDPLCKVCGQSPAV